MANFIDLTLDVRLIIIGFKVNKVTTLVLIAFRTERGMKLSIEYKIAPHLLDKGSQSEKETQ